MKARLAIIFLCLFGILSSLTFTLEYLEKNGNDSNVSFLWIFIIPGFILYVITTGDIHGWQPGPIGQSGRVLITGFGSAIFWTTIFYFILRRRYSN